MSATQIETTENTRENTMITRVRDVINAYLDKYGASMRELSLSAGDNPGLVADVLSRSRAPRRSTISRLAGAMGIDMADMIDPTRPIPAFKRIAGTDNAVVVTTPAATQTGEIRAVATIPGVRITEQGLEPDPSVSFALSVDFIRRTLNARPDFLRVVISESTDGDVRYGDWVILDTFETLSRSPGYYATPQGIAYKTEPAQVFGRAVWTMRRV